MTEKHEQLLETLVGIPSLSTQEGPATTYLTQWLHDQGVSAFVDEVGNVVGHKGDGPREIMLLGHVDTFPGNPPVYREGNLLYGRGSVDAKGPLCTFAAALASLEVPAGWRVTVVGAVEEESPTSRGARHMLACRKGRPPEFCIIGEPSQWDRITLAYKGRLIMQVNMQIPYAHSAGQAPLPAEYGVNLWHAIQEYANSVNQGQKSIFDKLDVSLQAINTSEVGSYGQVTMSIGFRLPLHCQPNALEAAIRELVGTYTEDWQTDLEFVSHEQAYRSSKSTPLVRAFLRGIREAGGQPRFVAKTGTSDMNVVAPVWQCPTVAYGPGDSSLDHTPEEHIDLTEYSKAIEVLGHSLQQLMQP